MAQYYQDRTDLGDYFWNSHLNRLVWIGGQDVTGFVLGYVLDKYNFPKAKQVEVLKFVEDLRSRDF